MQQGAANMLCLRVMSGVLLGHDIHVLDDCVTACDSCFRGFWSLPFVFEGLLSGDVIHNLSCHQGMSTQVWTVVRAEGVPCLTGLLYNIDMLGHVIHVLTDCCQGIEFAFEMS